MFQRFLYPAETCLALSTVYFSQLPAYTFNIAHNTFKASLHLHRNRYSGRSLTSFTWFCHPPLVHWADLENNWIFIWSSNLTQCAHQRSITSTDRRDHAGPQCLQLFRYRHLCSLTITVSSKWRRPVLKNAILDSTRMALRQILRVSFYEDIVWKVIFS